MNAHVAASFTYDAADRLLSVFNVKSTGAVIASAEHGYNSIGNRIHVADAAGERTSWTYDNSSQLTSEHRSGTSGFLQTFTYDTAGNQTLRIDARGNRTTYAYDAAAELLNRQYPDDTRATFAYDLVGSRTLMQNRDTTVTTVYDTVSRRQSVSSTMDSATKTISYAYDSVGNRSHMIDPDGGRFTYAYDAANRITVVRNPQNDPTTFAYDAGNRRTVKKLANGSRASFTYDAANQVTRLANLKSDGTTISSFAYEYNANGNRTSILENDGSRVSWTYDDSSQLLSEHRTGTSAYRNTFVYDPVGNRTLKNESGVRTTYAYDLADQLATAASAAGTTTYTFDANGNQQIVESPTADRTTTTWDYEDKPARILLPAGGRNTFAYNAEGLRIEKQDSDGTTRFVWDGQQYLLETNEAGNVLVAYTNAPGQYTYLISQYQDAQAQFPHFDALGSTRQLTDSSENTTDTFLYDAWGNELARTGITPLPFRWVGRHGYYFDPNTGTFYILARNYEPQKARWTSVDPAGFIDGPNVYTYVQHIRHYCQIRRDRSQRRLSIVRVLVSTV